MDFSRVINLRHSIRAYQKKKVPEKILKEIIIDGCKAPSAKNIQPWRFYVVVSDNKREKMSNLLKKSLEDKKLKHENLSLELRKVLEGLYSNLGNCQNIIFVFMKLTEEVRRDSNIESVSCAIENIMLSAVNQGLGTCWIGSFKIYEKEVKEILDAKEDEELIGALLIGYIDPEFKILKRDRKKLEEIMKFV